MYRVDESGESILSAAIAHVILDEDFEVWPMEVWDEALLTLRDCRGQVEPKRDWSWREETRVLTEREGGSSIHEDVQ